MSMYAQGFVNGRKFAIGRAFGDKKPDEPYFETKDEYYDYYAGFDAGFYSVDD